MDSNYGEDYYQKGREMERVLLNLICSGLRAEKEALLAANSEYMNSIHVPASAQHEPLTYRGLSYPCPLTHDPVCTLSTKGQFCSII